MGKVVSTVEIYIEGGKDVCVVCTFFLFAGLYRFGKMAPRALGASFLNLSLKYFSSHLDTSIINSIVPVLTGSISAFVFIFFTYQVLFAGLFDDTHQFSDFGCHLFGPSAFCLLIPF